MSSVTYDWFDDLYKDGTHPSSTIRIDNDGRVQFIFNDNDVTKLNRGAGPAYISPMGAIVYKINDKLHRVSGPAVIGVDGFRRYFVNGIRLSELEFFTTYGVM